MVKYDLEEIMEPGKNAAYSLQHMVLFIANAAIIPVIIAKNLGLSDVEISEMLLRTFFFCGLLSILQTRFGHRYPIIDGPSGLWLTVWINLASVTSALGGDLAALRTNIVFGMMVAGLFVIVLGFSGLMKYIAKLFSPLVNGVFLVLMPIQLSKSFISGMLGTVYGGNEIDLWSLTAFWITVTSMILVNIFGTPFIKSIAILIAIAIGWVYAVAIGIGNFGDMSGLSSVIILPEIFPWGNPTLDPGILITILLGSFLIFSNIIASLHGMADLIKDGFNEKRLNRGTIFFGVTTIATGAFGTIGGVPFATSIGIVRMTGVAARRPFYIGSAAMIILGILGPVGMFFAAIPPSVGYGAILVLFGVIVKQGIDFFRKGELSERKGLALGISLLTGTGIMMQPLSLFESLPSVIEPFVSNGLLVGVILSVILEQALKERKVQN